MKRRIRGKLEGPLLGELKWSNLYTPNASRRARRSVKKQLKIVQRRRDRDAIKEQRP